MDTAVADCLRAADGGAITGSAILALCVLDYLSTLRNKHPGGGNAVNYKALVNDFLHPINSRYCGADLYWFRNALVHTYATADMKKDTTIARYSLTHKNPSHHLAGSATELQINVDSFVADVILAVDDFLTGAVGNTAVEAAADNLMIVQAVSDADLASRTYASMHAALGALDILPVDKSQLRSDVKSRFK